MTARITSGQARQAGKLVADMLTSRDEPFKLEFQEHVLAGEQGKEFQRLVWEVAKDMMLRGAQQPAMATGLVPDGYEVVEDIAPSDFDVAALRPHPILKGGESYIGGVEMRRRADDTKANLGLADGKKILDNQGQLSAEFNGKVIPLPGTVLRAPDGDLFVGCLCQGGGGRWRLRFHWLGVGWGVIDRFAVSE